MNNDHKTHWSLGFAKWFVAEKPGLKKTYQWLKDRPDLVANGIYMCPGCGQELAMRLGLIALGHNVVLTTPGGCLAATAGIGERSNLKVPGTLPLLSSGASLTVGIKRGLRKLGAGDIPVVAFAGDGSTGDLSFGNLSGAAERRENIIYVCFNNEGYMNTGVQRAGSTPMGSWTTTTPAGKQEHAKELALLMALHPVAYAATASVAFPQDYIAKLRNALQVRDGMVYIEVFTPCPTGWRTDPAWTVEAARLAVETNYYPLWESRNGRLQLTKRVRRRKPVREFLRRIGKYQHLSDEDIGQMQRMVDQRYRRIRSLG